ncbi:helix-turn-helix transcriptional regulator [Chryseobacterium sp. Mn2064]|uniref:helix-turn-helix transcriptional regulator n=1 Tax=Chryseobacterium sp. Mn2064 TaxID=3395263 RepID=UPI003BBE58A7
MMFRQIWDYITNRHIAPNADPLERIEAQRINVFAFFIGIVLIIDGCRDLWFGLTANFYGLSSLGLFYLFLFFFTKVRYNVFVILFNLEVFLFMIFFFSSTTGFENGLSLYYFVIMLASLFVFNTKKTVWYNAIVYSTVFILFSISHYHDFRIFTIEGADSIMFSKNQRLITFLQVFLGFIILGYFIVAKQFKIIELYRRTLRSEDIIAEMRIKLNSKDQADLEGLVKLAMNDDIAFIPRIKNVFPDLYDHLILINKDMTADEFKLWALLKLGFTTKDIAEYNHLAVRTIQTRKSRLRKSFGIATEVDLYKWIDSI